MAAGVCSTLITPPLERSQKRPSEVSPTTIKRHFTGSIAGSMQPPKSDAGPSGPEPASAAVGVRSDLSTCILSTSSNNDVTATTSNSTAIPGGSTIQLTLKQGLSRIFARNQQNDDRPITSWHEQTGAYGGREEETINTACSTLPVTSNHQPPETDGNDADRAIHEWVSSSPFQKPAPEQLVAAVRSALQASNEEFSTQCGGVLAGWNDLQVPDLAHPPIASPGLIDSACWEVLPSSNWFESPLGR